MNTLEVNLENCYGIRKIDYKFDFSGNSAYAIYAPNGVMKSSFASVFKDLCKNEDSKDRLFPNRQTIRNIKDENGKDLLPNSVFVIHPYEEEFDSLKSTARLLLNTPLRKRYEKVTENIKAAEEDLLGALVQKSKLKKKETIKKEVSLAFTDVDDEFIDAIFSMERSIRKQTDTPFANVDYAVIFNEKVLKFLEEGDIISVLEDYTDRYNQLLTQSTFFQKGVFTDYNARVIANNLNDNGFFKAGHKVVLNGRKVKEVQTVEELEAVIEEERAGITDDSKLKSEFDKLRVCLEKNQDLRDFFNYIQDKPEVVSNLSNIRRLKRLIWESYVGEDKGRYFNFIELLNANEDEIESIKKEAREQKSDWEEVLLIFKNRFIVPFDVSVKNNVNVILGQDSIPLVKFEIQEGEEFCALEKKELLESLSSGEKRALYLLQVIFEIKMRADQEGDVLLIFDDVADSFDYKNKYAIIEYLKDIPKMGNFKQIILTHNFDFFRTINSRGVVKRDCSLMCYRTDSGVSLEQSYAVKDYLKNVLKKEFISSKKHRISAIPFMRNLIEYTSGDSSDDYLKLTSLLHMKEGSSDKITHNDLVDIFNRLFGKKEKSSLNGDALVLTSILDCADKCLNDPEGINFENKIVLSIASRIVAEQFMIDKINDKAFVSAITSTQTPKLFERFKELYPTNSDAIHILQKVMLITPETIHLNSFMYEPILDMSDSHLRSVYKEVRALKEGVIT